MRDMKVKFGAQVESFRYAFVLPNHAEGWEDRASAHPGPTAVPPARTGVEADPLHLRRATDKQPTYIEIKPK